MMLGAASAPVAKAGSVSGADAVGGKRVKTTTDVFVRVKAYAVDGTEEVLFSQPFMLY